MASNLWTSRMAPSSADTWAKMDEGIYIYIYIYISTTIMCTRHMCTFCIQELQALHKRCGLPKVLTHAKAHAINNQKLANPTNAGGWDGHLACNSVPPACDLIPKLCGDAFGGIFGDHRRKAHYSADCAKQELWVLCYIHDQENKLGTEREHQDQRCYEQQVKDVFNCQPVPRAKAGLAKS